MKSITTRTLCCDTEERERSSQEARCIRNQNAGAAAMEDKINIAGIDKAELLAALHNGTRAIGMGMLHDLRRDITVAEAREDWEEAQRRGYGYFDYYHGRPLKVNLGTDYLDPRLYDRDAGIGKAAQVINGLKRA